MYETGIQSPIGVWWKPAHRAEKVWIGVAFAWCMVLFAMMPLWHIRGGQNTSGVVRLRTPAGFCPPLQCQSGIIANRTMHQTNAIATQTFSALCAGFHQFPCGASSPVCVLGCIVILREEWLGAGS